MHNFMYKASCDSRNDATESENESTEVNYHKLNKKQKAIFNQIETHYTNTISGHQVELLRILIMGTAKTRKSYPIKAIMS